MDEIEYKLNTRSSVLVVNAIDKLISGIKSKYKPAERKKFVLENEELKFLREKCSSKDPLVSVTACQGLLALVELGILETAYTMSTVVTLLPSAHNYSAIISTMSGLLVLDMKSRLVPGQQYKCQFSLKSPQHPFITVLERNKAAEDDVLAQMQALCTHSDYIIQSNSLELLRAVFLYLTCNPQREGSLRPWQLLLSLPQTKAQCSLLLACLSCQQICNPANLERAFSSYCAVTDAAIFQRDEEYVAALLPMLARISNQMVKQCRDPRPCYQLIERCISLGGERLRPSAGIALHLVASNLTDTTPLCTYDTLVTCYSIMTKFECPSISVNALIAHTLQWLHLPSYLTTSALKVASKILDHYRENSNEDTKLNIPNLKSNKIFNYLDYTDSKLTLTVKLHSVWERIRDDPDKLKSWLDGLSLIDNILKMEFLSFLYGIFMERNNRYEEIVLRVLKIIVGLVDYNKNVAVELLPILVYKVANDESPIIKMECLKAIPIMAKAKENVPNIVSILNKLKVNKGVPRSFLIYLYASLADTQIRCFPYLQELLVEAGTGRTDDLKWEIEIAKITGIQRICETRASSHGLQLVPLVSSTLSGGGAAGAVAAAGALRCVRALWARAALAPPAAWRALRPRLHDDTRPAVLHSLCDLLGEIPALSRPTPEYEELSRSAAARLWKLIAEGTPPVIEHACRALAKFPIDSYTLKDIPEIYRKTVILPASYCKTPADAVRKPEDVLDYIPCEIWPEVYKNTNYAALDGVTYLLRKVIEREVGNFRSGAYHLEGGREPTTYKHLQPASAVRGLMDCFRKQVTSPSHEFTEPVTLTILETLSAEFPKPLPPIELHFLIDVCGRGEAWRNGGVKLAARMSKVSPSAKIVIENWLQVISSGRAAESDIILLYELLPTLTRIIPPNTLRSPIERSLANAYSKVSQIKAKIPYEQTFIINLMKQCKTDNIITINKDEDNLNIDNSEDVAKETDSVKKNDIDDEEKYLFIKQLKLLKLCLECDSIHEANRTLLSQMIEHYFNLISDDNVAWPAYVDVCSSLSSKYVERLSSPSSWWEVSGGALRRAGALRAALARADGARPLCWLNEMIDAHVGQLTEQDFSLQYIFVSAIHAAQLETSKEWFLQLLARTQVAFKESESMSSKRYLCGVVCAAAAALSGAWAGAAAPGAPPAADLPLALYYLMQRPGWGDSTLQVLEWLWHTRDCMDREIGVSCQRALLALRHTEPFATHKIWTRLESYFGVDIVQTEA